MHSHLGPVVGLLVALTWADLSAQQSACTLLTPGDIETITGAPPLGEPHKTNIAIPEGPQKGQTLNGCMWSTTGSGMVSVSMMPAPEGVAREAAIAKLEEVYGQLRAQHWAEEKKSFPDGSCSIMTPPPGKQDAPIMSQCVAEAKGKVMSSVFMSPTQKLSMEDTRALMDKAVSHMQ